MKDSDNVIVKKRAVCGHEVAITINNYDDLVAASPTITIFDIEKAIKETSCQYCMLKEYKKE